MTLAIPGAGIRVMTVAKKGANPTGTYEHLLAELQQWAEEEDTYIFLMYDGKELGRSNSVEDEDIILRNHAALRDLHRELLSACLGPSSVSPSVQERHNRTTKPAAVEAFTAEIDSGDIGVDVGRFAIASAGAEPTNAMRIWAYLTDIVRSPNTVSRPRSRVLTASRRCRQSNDVLAGL
ncbi:hypothetical protein, partial [Rhodococcus wratislaviensis]